MTTCESCERPDVIRRTRCSHCLRLLCTWCYAYHKVYRTPYPEGLQGAP